MTTSYARHLEPMTIWIQAHQEILLTTEDFFTSMKDMQGYIERMGGSLEQKTPYMYRFYVPHLWVGKIHERFKSFGITANVLGDHQYKDDYNERIIGC